MPGAGAALPLLETRHSCIVQHFLGVEVCRSGEADARSFIRTSTVQWWQRDFPDAQRSYVNPIASSCARAVSGSFREAAARFSCRWATEEVPGISKIFGAR